MAVEHWTVFVKVFQHRDGSTAGWVQQGRAEGRLCCHQWWLPLDQETPRGQTGKDLFQRFGFQEHVRPSLAHLLKTNSRTFSSLMSLCQPAEHRFQTIGFSHNYKEYTAAQYIYLSPMWCCWFQGGWRHVERWGACSERLESLGHRPRHTQHVKPLSLSPWCMMIVMCHVILNQTISEHQVQPHHTWLRNLWTVGRSPCGRKNHSPRWI